MRATRTTIVILTATLAEMVTFATMSRAQCLQSHGCLEILTQAEIDTSPFVFCTKPNTMLVGGKCIHITMGGGAPIRAAHPTCPQDYELLTYPGTWTPICARDLQAPK